MKTEQRSWLGRVRGKGSAHEGTTHWIQQRLTALLMVFLTPWFFYQVLTLPHGHYEALIVWFHNPLNALGMLLFLGVSFFHAVLGAKVIIEDYVNHPGWKIFCLAFLQIKIYVWIAIILIAFIKIYSIAP
jgi:succinate dehydrogenase / fumarate reductase membrane anchor subunit